MSSLVVEVCRVDKVIAHPNADKMAVATIKGWKTCIRKNEDGSTQFAEGDLCIFVPPDAVLPKELSDKLGVTNYLNKLAKKTDGSRPEGGRVVVSRLRGQPSYGFITNLDILPAKRGPDSTIVGEFIETHKEDDPEFSELAGLSCRLKVIFGYVDL